MGLDGGEIIINAAILGLLVGIVWSLKYIVSIDRRIERLENKISRVLTKKK